MQKGTSKRHLEKAPRLAAEAHGAGAKASEASDKKPRGCQPAGYNSEGFVQGQSSPLIGGKLSLTCFCLFGWLPQTKLSCKPALELERKNLHSASVPSEWARWTRRNALAAQRSCQNDSLTNQDANPWQKLPGIPDPALFVFRSPKSD